MLSDVLIDLEGDIFRAKYSQKEREKMDASDFGDPEHLAFPIMEPEDVIHAAERLGEASGDKATIKKNIIKIAKRKGFALPTTWEDEDEMNTKADAPDILRAMPTEMQLYMPILRFNKDKREVIVKATSEALDSYGTVFSYEASKDAFNRWRGNVREMHDPTKAVGKALKWEPLEDEKAIELTLRVSKGAEDTWLKVLDGTLAGASVGAKNGKWVEKEINGEMVPYLERYDLVEVSLVDNPANPDCMVSIVRADGMATEIVDAEPDLEEDATRQQETPEETRAGAKISHVTQQALHGLRDGALQQAKSTMKLCADDGCEECQKGLNALDPDGDGDIDIIPSLDYDGDGGAGSGDGSAYFGMEKAVKAELTRHLTPIITRMNGIAARFAQVDPQIQPGNTPDITRRLDAFEQKLTELSEVRSLLSEVKGLVELMAAQPRTGGVIVNSAAARAAQATTQAATREQEAQLLRSASFNGQLTKEQQIQAALYLQGKQG